MEHWCHEGKCYSSQDYNECVGKGLGSTAEGLGDGTRCFNEKKHTTCLAVPGNTDLFIFIFVTVSGIK